MPRPSSCGAPSRSGQTLPSIGQWVAPTLDPQELERRINELRDIHLETRKQYALGLMGRTETMIVDEVHAGEVTLRRAHDAPESDEIVTAPLPGGMKLLPGDMPQVTLKAYTEYSFLGEIKRPVEG